jgi:hypothetical protein
VSASVEVVGVYGVPGEPVVHLVEVVVDRRPSEVDVGAFTQEEPGSPREDWQVPWMEHYLNADGTRLAAEVFEVPDDDVGPTRLAFFLHFLAFDRSLITPFGEVELPAPRSMPGRLVGKVEFEPVD